MNLIIAWETGFNHILSTSCGVRIVTQIKKNQLNLFLGLLVVFVVVCVVNVFSVVVVIVAVIIVILMSSAFQKHMTPIWSRLLPQKPSQYSPFRSYGRQRGAAYFTRRNQKYI